MNTWAGMDPDDINGYLMDELSTFVDKHDLNDIADVRDFMRHDDDDNVLNLLTSIVQAIREKENG